MVNFLLNVFLCFTFNIYPCFDIDLRDIPELVNPINAKFSLKTDLEKYRYNRILKMH